MAKGEARKFKYFIGDFKGVGLVLEQELVISLTFILFHFGFFTESSPSSRSCVWASLRLSKVDSL